MANELLYPYAYDEELQDYLAPDDQQVRQDRPYKVGTKTVYLRVPTEKRRHFWDPTPGGGGGGGIETAAHVYAKKFYKHRMHFAGTILRQPLLIRFEDCILEQRLDERTPDLTATILECWPPFMKRGDKFLIEIHATNSVFDNPRRPEALARIGIPCIEVDLPTTAIEWKFKPNADPDAERKRFEAYMDKVLSEPFHCRWIVPNPPPTFIAADETITLIRPQASQTSPTSTRPQH